MNLIINKRYVLSTLCLLFLGLVIPAYADLQLIHPNESLGVTFFGNGGYSADGLGQNESGNVISAEIPAESTVLNAYLYASTFGDASDNININFDDTIVTLQHLDNNERRILLEIIQSRCYITSYL